MSGKQRNLRKKRALDEDGDGPDAEPEVQKETLEDLKLLQRMRKRTGGMDAAALAVKGTTEAGFSGTDEENKLMEAYVKAQGGQNVLDDEAHMQKYVEREMARRRGVELDEGEKKMSKAELEEMELYKVPEGLQAQLKQEVVIPGMMTAITEVEVSAEDKLRKIEETEAMKRRMLASSSGAGLPDEGGNGRKGKSGIRRNTVPSGFGRPGGKPKEPREPGDKPRHKTHLSQRDLSSGGPAGGKHK